VVRVVPTDSYLDFLRERFGPEKVDEELEAQAYSLVVDPPAMQDLIVSHLRKMWDEYLAPEWERTEPMLRDAVKAFRQTDLSNKSRLEAAEFITGQELKEEKWGPAFERDTLWMLFGARVPEGVQFHSPDLNRAEIAVRLDALADDVRLRILRLIAEKGELQSQEIMATLGLSQSAASRHLNATSSILSESKTCYTLSRAFCSAPRDSYQGGVNMTEKPSPHNRSLIVTQRKTVQKRGAR